MQAYKVVLIMMLTLLAVLGTSALGYSIWFEVTHPSPYASKIGEPAWIIACAMTLGSWAWAYYLFFIDGKVEAEAKQVDPDLLAYQKQKEAEHASFLAWQAEKEAVEKAALEEYQRRNKYSC